MNEFEVFTVFVKEDSTIRIELNNELEAWTNDPTTLMNKAEMDLIYTVVANMMERLKACINACEEE